MSFYSHYQGSESFLPDIAMRLQGSRTRYSVVVPDAAGSPDPRVKVGVAYKGWYTAFVFCKKRPNVGTDPFEDTPVELLEQAALHEFLHLLLKLHRD